MIISGGKIIVIGLGYVGLPLAVALAKAHPDAEVVGFDIDNSRIAELRQGVDRTLEVEQAELSASPMTFTGSDEDCAGADFFIVTVPTPVDERNKPDLGALLAASRRLAGWIDPERRPTIIFESTVYPGATEAGGVALLGAAAGVLVGVAMAFFLVRVLRPLFVLRPAVVLPVRDVAILTGLVIAVSVLAALAATVLINRLPATELLRDE